MSEDLGDAFQARASHEPSPAVSAVPVAIAIAGPVRVQLSRAKGWRMPPNTVKVDRTTKWGNPFVANHPNNPALRKAMVPALAVASFRSMLEKEGSWSPIPLPWPSGKIPAQWTSVDDVRAELRGKNLACWCPIGSPCHADVLLELANKAEQAS